MRRLPADPRTFLLAFTPEGDNAYAFCRFVAWWQRALSHPYSSLSSPKELPAPRALPPCRTKGFASSGASLSRAPETLGTAAPLLNLLTGGACRPPGCLVLAGVECVRQGAARCSVDAYGNLGSGNLGGSPACGRDGCDGVLRASVPANIYINCTPGLGSCQAGSV